MMNTRLELHESTRKLPPSKGLTNTITITFYIIAEEIHEDPATGIQTLIESKPDQPDYEPYVINFSINSICHDHICHLLLDRLMNLRRLSESLATRIASVASELGFGINGFEIDMHLTLTKQRVFFVSSDSVLQRLVCQGTIDGEELERLKIKTEPCSICLESLSVSKTGAVPTRMPCSHVFHDRCLLEWFSRKNTCPMCRRLVSQATEE